ncbi:hypothetical protein KAU25_04095 [Candidatus Bathyarchaeota archaeon]|jgi:hypothetical protein|nr:hypothetical protein [Candidatus Bathyarchaeota archaeon]
MSEKETIDAVKSRQGVFAKIQNVITGGYGTKEDLRELDKQLRDIYYSDFKALRHRWEEIYLAALESSQEEAGSHLKKVIQTLDRVGEKVHRADYGYAGLMDRKGSIRENELARVFNYDKSLGESLAGIKEEVKRLHDDSENEEWSSLTEKVKSVKSMVLEFESKWNEREKEFRYPEV